VEVCDRDKRTSLLLQSVNYRQEKFCKRRLRKREKIGKHLQWTPMGQGFVSGQLAKYLLEKVFLGYF
jgi:hypothetical protein